SARAADPRAPRCSVSGACGFRAAQHRAASSMQEGRRAGRRRAVRSRLVRGPRVRRRLRAVHRVADAAGSGRQPSTSPDTGQYVTCSYRDGTTHIVLEPLDFMARLAALVPPPRAPPTRSHGVLAPGSALRAAVTPSGRGQGSSKQSKAQDEEGGVQKKALGMTWAQRLKRVFAIEIETCQRCGGKLEVIASIEDAELIGRILEHRAQHGDDDLRGTPFAPRAPPQPLLF